MIRKLQHINSLSAITQNEQSNIYSISTLSFEENELGSGGFGSVHKVLIIDGKASAGYAIKILKNNEQGQHSYDTIKLLHEKLNRRQTSSPLPIFHDSPELMGLPFLAFKAHDTTIDEPIVGLLMYNLISLGFEDYGNDDESSEQFNALNLYDKAYLAYQLARSVNLLHEIHFIHSDLKESSIFINSQSKQLALIDYDNGFHYDEQKKSSTIGAIGHWISDKIKRLIRDKISGASMSVSERLQEERWVLANGIFELIWGMSSFFFLKDSDIATRQQYNQAFTWPNIDYNSNIVNSSAIATHEILLSNFQQLKESTLAPLIEGFINVFQEGYNKEDKRKTAAEWKKLLYEINNKLNAEPNIIDFNASSTKISRKNEAITFKWKTEKYSKVYLNNKLQDINQNETTILVQDDTKYTLKVANDFSIVEEEVNITAKKVIPQINNFYPSKYIRDSTDSIQISWDIENADYATLSNSSKKLSLKGNIDIQPTADTRYILTAHGFFDEKITKEITIKVIKPIILDFYWEVNLFEGIDNVDLKWQTKDVKKVVISPLVGEKLPNGKCHIAIEKKTKFKLIAYGLFSQVEKEIIAHPFPVPVITHLFTKTPKVDINIIIDAPFQELPTELMGVSKMVIDNFIPLEESLLKISPFKLDSIPTLEIEPPKITYPKFEETFSYFARGIYEKIRTKISKKYSK